MKTLSSFFCWAVSALLFMLSIVCTTLVSRAADNPASRGEIKVMDEFLDTHSVIADELRHHPALADDPAFLKAHPDYATFVAEHPGVAEQLKQHPRYFVHRAMAAQRKQPITAEEIKKLDEFLDKHPDIEKELLAEPRLIEDPKFIEAHPELHKFINHHPGVDGALESKPNETIKRESQHEEHEQSKTTK